MIAALLLPVAFITRLLLSRMSVSTVSTDKAFWPFEMVTLLPPLSKVSTLLAWVIVQFAWVPVPELPLEIPPMVRAVSRVVMIAPVPDAGVKVALNPAPSAIMLEDQFAAVLQL